MKELSNVGIFTILLASSLTIMVGTVIAPSLLEIAKQLGFTDNPGWLVTLPSLGVILFAPIMGSLIDKKGPYVMMCWGLVPYSILGVLGAFLDNPYIVVIDRLLLGAATAAVQVSASGLIADFFTGEKRMKMMARQGMAIELGGVVFLSLGGYLGEKSWQLPFSIYGMALVCLILTIVFIPKPANAIEQRSRETLPNKKFSISSNILQIVIIAAIAMILFFVAFVSLPQYLPSRFSFSESETGYFMAFISLIAVVSAGAMPKISLKLGPWNTVALGFFLFVVGYVLFAISPNMPLLISAAVATGIGFGLTVPLLNHMTVENSNSTNRGRNLSYYSIGIFGGQFLSTFVEMLTTEARYLFVLSSLIAMVTAISLFLKKPVRDRAFSEDTIR